jgi:hypothetical protein
MMQQRALSMSSFSKTHTPPTLRLGDTADPIMVVPQNTAAQVSRVTLIRPVIVRVPKPSDVVIESKVPSIRRHSKRPR